MSSERRLIRPTHLQPNTYADIVGLLHPSIHQQVNNKTTSNSSDAATGRIDSTSSLGIVVTPTNSLIHIWKNISCTLSENLQSASHWDALKFSCGNTASSASSIKADLVAIVPYGGNRTTQSQQTQHQGRLQLYGVFACNEKGELCMWNHVLLDGSNNSNSSSTRNINRVTRSRTRSATKAASAIAGSSDQGRKPDNMTTLSFLETNEIVTTITPVLASTGNDYGGVLIGTQKNRTFMVYKTNKRVDLVVQEFSNKLQSPATDYYSSTSRKLMGVFKGFMGYNGSTSSSNLGDNTSTEQGLDPILSIFDLSSSQGVTSTSSGSGYNKIHSNDNRKALKIYRPCFFLTIQKDLSFTKWSLNSDRSSQNQEQVEAFVNCSKETKMMIWNDITMSIQQQDDEYDGYTEKDVRLTPLATAVSQNIVIMAVIASLGGTSHHRLYLLQYSLSFTLDVNDDEKTSAPFLSLQKAHWLSRYSTEFSKSAKCSGLVVTQEQSQESNIGMDDNSNTGPSSFSSSSFVIYSSWEQQKLTQQQVPTRDMGPAVTVTALHISSQQEESQAYDLEMPSQVVPSILGVGITEASEGALLMSQSGCIIQTRIKTKKYSSSARSPGKYEKASTSAPGHPSAYNNSLSVAGGGNTEHSVNLQTLNQHLLSAFHVYYSSIVAASSQRNSNANSSSQRANNASVSSFVPPSLLHAPISQLNTCVIQTSHHLLIYGLPSNNSSMDEDITTASSTSNNVAPAATRSDTLQEKIRIHQEFCNFLTHAAIYKRITLLAKSVLADHGEIIVAKISLITLITRKTLKSLNNNNVDGGANANAIATYISFLEEIDKQPSSDLMGLLLRLHETLLPNASNDQNRILLSQVDKTQVLHLTQILYTVISTSLRYRLEKADICYDLPDRGDLEHGGNLNPATNVTAMEEEEEDTMIVPWTVSNVARNLLTRHLIFLKSFIEINSDNSTMDISTKQKEQIELLGSVLLDAHHTLCYSILQAGPSSSHRSGARRINETNRSRMVHAYNTAKQIVIPSLVQKLSGDQMALKMSVKHFYFEGIASACSLQHDHAYELNQCALFQTATAKTRMNHTEKEYTLPHLLKNYNRVVDYDSGLSFPSFLLQWLSNRNKHAQVLELGEYCPAELQTFLKSTKSGGSGSNFHQWMEDVRAERWKDASKSLTELVVTISETSNPSQQQQQSLEDKRFFLSLAKLTSKIGNDGNNEDEEKEELNDNFIKNGLELCRAQDMLMANSLDQLSPNHAYSKSDLLNEVVRQLMEHQTLELDYSQRVNAGLIGLAICETFFDSGHSHYEVNMDIVFKYAAQVWIKSILSDMESVWRTLIDEWKSLTDEEVKNGMRATVFYGIAQKYHLSKQHLSSVNNKVMMSEENKEMKNLNFLDNQNIQKYVLDEIGAEDSSSLNSPSDNPTRKLLLIASTLAKRRSPSNVDDHIMEEEKESTENISSLMMELD